MSTDSGTSDPRQWASHHVFEIRYRPNAKILDRRGEWAEELSRELGLPTWRIGPDRLDIGDEEREHHAFVSFTNSGYVMSNAPTANFFPDHAVKFFKHVLRLRDFPTPVYVTRIGVRQRFLSPFDGTLEDLVTRYSERYLRLTEAAKEAVAGKLLDLAGPLNFADAHGNFNTNCGPMHQDQAKTVLEGLEPERGFPSVGLFYDIDYWLRPEKELSEGNILSNIKAFSIEGWSRHDRVRQLIVGE